MLGALQPAGIETGIWNHHELVKPAGLVERVGRSQCRCISGEEESWRRIKKNRSVGLEKLEFWGTKMMVASCLLLYSWKTNQM